LRQLVRQAGGTSAAVRRFTTDLEEFADLRNAIVHERTDGHVIAEPNDRAVAEIEHIASLLCAPPKVLPCFQRDVLALQRDDSAAKAVEAMLEESFSQVPIYDGERFLALLTTNTVARWLGSSVEEDIFSLSETCIPEVLQYIEDQDNHCFLGRGATLFEVLEEFQGRQRSGKRLDAILITHGGKRSESLLGIITVWDLPKVHDILEGHGRD